MPMPWGTGPAPNAGGAAGTTHGATGHGAPPGAGCVSRGPGVLDMVYLRGTGVPQSAENWATCLGRIAPSRRAFLISGTGSRDTVSEARHELYVPARQLHNMHPMAAGTI